MYQLLNKTLHLRVITKKMKSKNSLPAFSVAFFLLQYFFSTSLYGQGDHAGSFYLSAGYNQALWYSRSNIRIEQGEVGNSYSMLNVKGNNKTGTALSATQLSYRLGYFFNYPQTLGIEISYDPINYAVADQQVQIKGTYNSRLNQNTTVPFSKANGYYYHLSGANLFMVNFVRRYQLFRNNTKTLRVDVLAKGGIGPALPHISNRLGVNPVESGQFQFSGWAGGAEVAARVTAFRYGYVEIAGRYNYASFNNMKIYSGTAEQKLHNFEIVASIGGALPTTRLNPLFSREKRIITMLPFYQHKDEIGRKLRKKKLKIEDGDSLMAFGQGEVPEFDEIRDRNYRRNHPMVPVPEDSIEAGIFLEIDSAGNFISGDSSIVANYAEDHLSKKDLKKRKKQSKKDKKKAEQEAEEERKRLLKEEAEKAEAEKKAIADSISMMNPGMQEPETKAPAEVAAPPVVPEPGKTEEAKAPELSKKERKRMEKEAKRKEKEAEEERKRKEKEAEEERNRMEKEAVEKKAAEEKAAEAAAPPEVKEPEKKEEAKEEQKVPDASKKERKRREKAEREERKRKEQEEADKKKAEQNTEKKDN